MKQQLLIGHQWFGIPVLFCCYAVLAQVTCFCEIKNPFWPMRKKNKWREGWCDGTGHCVQCVISNENVQFFWGYFWTYFLEYTKNLHCLSKNTIRLALYHNFCIMINKLNLRITTYAIFFCIFLVQSDLVCMQQGIFDLGAKRAAAALLVLSQHRSREESHLFVALGILSKLIDEVASLVRPLLP